LHTEIYATNIALQNIFIMKHKILFSTFLLAASSTLCAQSIGPATFNAAGGSTTIGSNVWEFSLGEMSVVSTNSAGNISITHGVLQPSKNNPDAINDIAKENKNILVYPNPSNAQINISAKDGLLDCNGIVLYDAIGKIIYTNKNPQQINGTYSIDVQAFASGNYLLKITSNNNTQITNFIITKSN
jgi:hypothetical protein